MNKLLISVILAMFGLSAAFAQDASSSPELLKKKELYSKTELFEPAGIFVNPDINKSVIADYEANKASYADNALFPVAMCYFSTGNLPKGTEVLDAYLAAAPDNIPALKVKGDSLVFAGEIDKALEVYKKIYSTTADKIVLKSICMILFRGNKAAELAPYLSAIKPLSKEDADFAMFAMAYALSADKHDDALIKETLENMDVKAVLTSSTPQTLDAFIKVYSIKKDLFPARTLVIPARAAANQFFWQPAMEMYDAALKENAKDTLAMRGLALVEYRTGDVNAAANRLFEAYKTGDNEAVADAAELYVLSGSKYVWDKFLTQFKTAEIKPLIRVAMVQIADKKESAEIFYIACLGSNVEPLYKDKQVSELIGKVLEKFAKDARAADVKKLIDANQKK